MPAGYSLHRPMPNDAKLDALRANLATALTPEWYGNGSEAAVLQHKIRKYLEARNTDMRAKLAASSTAGWEHAWFPFGDEAA